MLYVVVSLHEVSVINIAPNTLTNAIAYVPNNNLGKIDFVPYVFLLFLVLMFFIFGGFGYYYGQELRSPRIASNLKSSSDIQLYNSMKEVPNVPEGTFNYGGALLLASLSASGTHAAVTKAYPHSIIPIMEMNSCMPAKIILPTSPRHCHMMS